MFLRGLVWSRAFSTGLGVSGVSLGYRAYQSSDSLEQFLTDAIHGFAGALRAASRIVTSLQNTEIMTLVASQQTLIDFIQQPLRSQIRASSFLSALLPFGLLGALVAACGVVLLRRRDRMPHDTDHEELFRQETYFAYLTGVLDQVGSAIRWTRRFPSSISRKWPRVLSPSAPHRLPST
uniref:Uncharacterized protein n=1 Tax=Haptolina ericina TaxID=156174 RepID=A0A7S3BCH6_9EUKA|mmetsp:Transcript_56403/g.125891  ORF Transcript_56403/g.125891 Transcript_56403/m.125891 type:complete len:179 (+) Transcript_56403:55-591(+)